MSERDELDSLEAAPGWHRIDNNRVAFDFEVGTGAKQRLVVERFSRSLADMWMGQSGGSAVLIRAAWPVESLCASARLLAIILAMTPEASPR